MTDLTYTNEWAKEKKKKIWTRPSALCTPVHWEPGDQEISYCMNRTNSVSGEICKMHISQGASCFDNHAQNLRS